MKIGDERRKKRRGVKMMIGLTECIEGGKKEEEYKKKNDDWTK